LAGLRFFHTSSAHGRRRGFLFCRRFTTQVKQLRDQHMALQMIVGSTALDGKTFEQHYREGTVPDLMTMINVKRAGRMYRDNRPISVRVVQQYPDGVTVKALDLDDVETIERDSKLRPEQQRANAGRTIRCHWCPGKTGYQSRKLF